MGASVWIKKNVAQIHCPTTKLAPPHAATAVATAVIVKMGETTAGEKTTGAGTVKPAKHGIAATEMIVVAIAATGETNTKEAIVVVVVMAQAVVTAMRKVRRTTGLGKDEEAQAEVGAAVGASRTALETVGRGGPVSGAQDVYHRTGLGDLGPCRRRPQYLLVPKLDFRKCQRTDACSDFLLAFFWKLRSMESIA